MIGRALSPNTIDPTLDQRPSRIRKVLQRCSHAVIRVYDESGNVIETHEHKGDSSSTNAVSFSSARTTKRFPSPGSR
jgi:hypothetical protein